MPERPRIMDLPRQIAAAARTRLPLNPWGKAKLPRPPSHAQLAARRESYRAACADHLALYPKLPCVLCHETEAVEAFVIARTADARLPLAVPLCFSCRGTFEQSPPLPPIDVLQRFRRHGIDALLLAQALRYWSGVVRAMEIAIEAHTRQALLERDPLRVTLR